MPSLHGIELQLGPNGYVSREVSFLDYTKLWCSTSFETSIRGNNDSLILETTLYNGTKVFSKYANSSTNVIHSFSSANRLDKYSRLLLISHTIQGTDLSKNDLYSLYAKYKEHQIFWSKRNILLQKLQDPEILDKQSILDKLQESPPPPDISLKMPLTVSKVFFADNSQFEYTIWSSGEFCDFKFTVVEFKPFKEGDII